MWTGQVLKISSQYKLKNFIILTGKNVIPELRKSVRKFGGNKSNPIRNNNVGTNLKNFVNKFGFKLGTIKKIGRMIQIIVKL